MLTQEIKQEFINEAISHREQDLLVKGQFWDGHKGCSVGCFAKTERNPHEVLADRLDVPEWIIRLQDTIFEGLPEPKNLEWHTRFAKAMPVGLTNEQFEWQILRPFMIVVLESVMDTFDHDEYPDVKKSIDTVLDLYRSGETDLQKFKDAAYAAAYAAARAAARAAYAAYAAAYAADSASYAAYAAAYAAADAAKYEYFADELIELMENAEKGE